MNYWITDWLSFWVTDPLRHWATVLYWSLLLYLLHVILNIFPTALTCITAFTLHYCFVATCVRLALTDNHHLRFPCLQVELKIFGPSLGLSKSFGTCFGTSLSLRFRLSTLFCIWLYDICVVSCSRTYYVAVYILIVLEARRVYMRPCVLYGCVRPEVSIPFLRERGVSVILSPRRLSWAPPFTDSSDEEWGRVREQNLSDPLVRATYCK